LNKITKAKQKKIQAVIKGNGELQDILMAKFLCKFGKLFYRTFTLDSVANPIASQF
jgi:hypothetical protein